jgi:hypothetical protein
MSVVNPIVTVNSNATIPDNQVLILTGVIVIGTYPIRNRIWTKDSGPDCAFTAASSCITQVYELYPGTYVFRLTVTDQQSNTGTATCTITVQANGGPIYYSTNNYAATETKAGTPNFYPQVSYTKPLDII